MKKIAFFLLITILIVSLVSAAIDPALIFCKDAGYETEFGREGGTYCVSLEGIECKIQEYYCKCQKGSCWNHIVPSTCELPCPEILCIKEGETNTIYGCCEGLECLPLDRSYEDIESGDCEYSGWVGPQGCTCSNCGNNVCESWENVCNCPEDCQKLTFISKLVSFFWNIFRGLFS